eukprot:COSAG02_NODE_12862_length_1480_cov_14.085445_1_plen_119_part_10
MWHAYDPVVQLKLQIAYEQAVETGTHKEVRVKIGAHGYVVDLGKMVQRNVESKFERPVRESKATPGSLDSTQLAQIMKASYRQSTLVLEERPRAWQQRAVQNAVQYAESRGGYTVSASM